MVGALLVEHLEEAVLVVQLRGLPVVLAAERVRGVNTLMKFIRESASSA